MYPVSPPKKTARRSPRTTHELHRVLSRPNQRPEKCRASVHASVSPATLVVPSQSSSTTRARGDAPPAQVLAHPERDDERRRGAPQQLADRGQVEVVVVVVGDDHYVDRGQLVQRQGRGVQAAGPEQRGRRDPVAPHRVHQHPAALHLQQHRGVAQPGDRELGGPRRDVRCDHRHRPQRPAAVPLAVQLAPQAAERADRRDHRTGQPVAEGAVAELAGARRPRQGPPAAGADRGGQAPGGAGQQPDGDGGQRRGAGGDRTAAGTRSHPTSIPTRRRGPVGTPACGGDLHRTRLRPARCRSAPGG